MIRPREAGAEQDRRVTREADIGPTRFGACVLNPARGVVTAPDGTETTLRPKTLELALLLLRQAGRVVSRAEILDTVWPGVFVTDDSITQCIVELRRAMGAEGTTLLRTVPRRGYLLDVVPQEQPAAPAILAGPTTFGGVPVVAVLPFRQSPASAGLSRVADGVLDGVVGALAMLREPVVISSNSSRCLSPETEPTDAARRLGAQYVASGSLRQRGDRLRVTVELAETAGATVLLQRQWDLPGADTFEAEDEVAAVIAHALAPRVREAELARARRARPGDLGAYHLLLEARRQIFRLERPAFEHAGALLRTAISRDPGAAEPLAALADWHSLRLGQGWSDDPEGDRQGLEAAAEGAIALDGRHPRALAMLGHNRVILGRGYDEALALFDRALGAAPNDAETWMWSSPTYAYRGEAAEAVRRAERAIALSPEDPLRFRYQCFAAIAHYAAEDFEQAAGWSRRAHAANPNYTSTLRVGIGALIETGARDEARRMAAHLLALEPDFRVGPYVERQAFRDAATRQAHGRRLLEAGLPV
jgi:DNA-binding winged helix-turn-helix (wHTH) protein/TolB-like protein